MCIKDKHKRIAEFSVGGPPLDTWRKHHWDYVHKWLAHDFRQECVWKIAAAAQVCHWVASAVRCRFSDIFYTKSKERMLAP
ncbi:hypothetical protein AQUCO_08900001v1 [Aquilegia coerulea]|uniref:Uncharacterized protein n=1 Tax=Aquilegia coerulea TaxID=218851 RepID=A0A2G5C637_AQUCA|nr:hypothetical protein AQUCO_08900001v1 [Aquilegia coerulea]